ncbi:MAG: hypothetical protein AB7L90_19180 [Hyphomicrobiaceae bacterium]
MAIRASAIAGGLDFSARVQIIEESTGIRTATRHEAPLHFCAAGERSFWLSQMKRRGIVDAWVGFEARNDAGTAGLSVLTASNRDMSADLIEHGPIYVPPSAADGVVKIPIDLGANSLFVTGDLFVALQFKISDGAEIGATYAFLSRAQA